MSAAEITARFITGRRGSNFVLLRQPAGKHTGQAVLIVPPFAEEMNKCRRMFTELAVGLTARGRAVVLVDLYGTGDSEGEFADADPELWLDDLSRAAQWSATLGWPVSDLLCVRLGCILGARLARALPQPISRTVFWQPVLAGDRFLTQFLRLRLAAAMTESGPKETLAELRARLVAGQAVEVAGYELSGRAAAQLDGLNLVREVGPQIGSLHWMEVVRSEPRALTSASEDCVQQLRGKGIDVGVHTAGGEPFWASTEIVINTDLVELSAALLGDGAASELKMASAASRTG